MMHSLANPHRFKDLRSHTPVGIVALLLLLGLCTAGCEDGTNGNGNGEEDKPTGSILNLTSNIKVSGEQAVTIVYNAGPAGADVDAFYIEVADTSADAATIGLPVTFDEDLLTGENQVTTLETGPLPLGIYRVGLNVTFGGETLRVYSLGTLELSTLPDPEFTLPNQNTFVLPGSNVLVSANVGDPENTVHWRLFFVDAGERPNVPADQYGTQIGVGSANVAEATWFTAGAPLGVYEIGVFITDSGQSIADTVASGNTAAIRGPFFNDFTVTLTTEEPQNLPPSLSVTEPASDKNILVTNPSDPNEGNVLVKFAATVFQGPPALQFIDVFHDFDGIANSGDETTISASLPVSATSAVFHVASIEVGTTAFIGVTVHDGVSAPVTRYAPGTVRRASFSDTVLFVSAPSSSAVIKPGDPVLVRWTLNAPEATSGSTSVYFRRVGANDQPLNTALVPADLVTNGLPLTQQSFTFPAPSSGRFRVTVKADLVGGPAPPPADAPALVVVSTLPEIHWLGDLTSAASGLRGTIFGGVQFEDNAGAAFAGGEDFNNDGLDDFVIVSRYAKPDAINPTGIGIGEAYLIRGSADLAGKAFNLNTVSSPALPGMAFKGVPIVASASNEETYGIASVYISSDADNDGIGEIWFGMPFANFAVVSSVDSTRPIERPGMFVHGGVVCVSSKNERVRGVNQFDVRGALIRLDEVGMLFQTDRIGPEPTGGEEPPRGECGDWLVQRNRYYNGDCPTGQAQSTEPFIGCVGEGSVFYAQAQDSGRDTLVNPTEGFSPVLANNYIQSMGSCSDASPDCPTCVPADAGPCNTTCTPWAAYLVPGYPINGAFLEHVTIEPLSPSDNVYCNGIGVDDGTVGDIGGGAHGPGTIDLPEAPPEGLSCELLKNLYGTFRNSLRPQGKGRNVVNLSDFLVNGYLLNQTTGIAQFSAFTGFYTTRAVVDGALVDNAPREPLGMRIIGRPPTSGQFGTMEEPLDHEEFSLFGTSITQVDDLMIISAPQRDAILDFDAIDFLPGVQEIENAGILYGFDNYAYWQNGTPDQQVLGEVVDTIPPKPHMFLAGGQGNNAWAPISGTGRWNLAFDKDTEVINSPPKIVGGIGEALETVIAVGDFNGDTRNDFAVGSPRRSDNDGAIYVVVRRAPSLEGDTILDKIALATNAAERLNGILITGDPGGGEQFGQVLASGVDFNGDGIGDLIVGVPLANGSIGEVVIVFSQSGIVTPEGGTTVEQLLTQRRGARITGSALDVGSEFGFTVGNAGDIDGDGKNDLLIAAPNATPRFDPTPSDAFDQLTEFGLDRDRNGVQDDVTGLLGRPDGQITDADDLRHAGLVYVILSSVDARTWATATTDYEINIDQLGANRLPGFIIVGRNGDRTALNGVVVNGDYLGGGNAANTSQGGTSDKLPIATVGGDRGRGFGLSAAGDVDGDGLDDFLLGSILADPRVSPSTGEGVRNGGEAYLIFGGSF